MVELPHGYTYSAHPIACAAGVAALDLLVKERGVERSAEMAPYFEEAVHSLKGIKHVTDIRNYGMAAGLTIDPLPGEPAKRPFDIAMKCFAKGVYVRFGGDTIQIAPPFIIEKPEIDRLVTVLGEALAETA
jgi:beta-alanine--pyruvate transaminase